MSSSSHHSGSNVSSNQTLNTQADDASPSDPVYRTALNDVLSSPSRSLRNEGIVNEQAEAGPSKELGYIEDASAGGLARNDAGSVPQSSTFSVSGAPPSLRRGSSVPSRRDLYGRVRTTLMSPGGTLGIAAGSVQPGETAMSKGIQGNSGTDGSGEARTAGTQEFPSGDAWGWRRGVPPTVVPQLHDPFLDRVRRNEREFDAKIRQLDDTFYEAGRQLVMRDDIIDSLQHELERLRIQLAEVCDEKHEYQRPLQDQMQFVMGQLRDEQSRGKETRVEAFAEIHRLREALAASEHREAKQREANETLQRQYEASERTQKGQRTNERLQLAECQRKLRHMGETIERLRRERAEAEQKGSLSKVWLSQAQTELEHQCQTSNLQCKELQRKNEQLQTELQTVRLSMARLLQVLAEVPQMQPYLKWNELGSEFVFLGYPTRYFQDQHNGRRNAPSQSPVSEGRRAARSLTSVPLVRHTTPTPFSRSPRSRTGGNVRGRSSGGRAHSVAHDRPSPHRQLMTGVEDGLYSGTTPSSKSKNVWFNDTWAHRLQEVIDSENVFTRLRSVKLLELEEAGMLTEQLPSAQDVLLCRRHEMDYWIPYAVFVEAQTFKNKYCPKLSAFDAFYPFLVRLNAIWNAKLQERMRVLKKEASQQVHLRDAQSCRQTCEGQLVHKHISSHDDHMPCCLSWKSILQPAYVELDRLQEELHRLRREVRLRTTNQRSIQLFCLYDELIKRALVVVERFVQYSPDSCGFVDTCDVDNVVSDSIRDSSLAAFHQEGVVTQQGEGPPEKQADVSEHFGLLLLQLCERVSSVSDGLSVNVTDCCHDMRYFLTVLRNHVQALQQAAAKDTVAMGGHSGLDFNKDQIPSEGGRHSHRRLQSQMRELLHQRYGEGDEGDRRRWQAGLSAHTFGDLDGAGGSNSPVSLMKVTESVLDFCQEVQKEVHTANTRLKKVCKDTMDAAALH